MLIVDVADLVRRLDVRLGERIGEHDQRIADLELCVGDLPARRLHAHPLLRPECLFVEVDRAAASSTASAAVRVW